MQTRVYPGSQKIEAWTMKLLSAGCVNTVVACRILITSDYVSQLAQRKLTHTSPAFAATLKGVTTALAKLDTQ